MAKINEAELKRKIKTNDFDNLYLIYGEEKMLVKLYTEQLQEKIIGKNPSDFNFHSFEEGADISQIAMSMDILPFAEPCNYVKISDLNVEKLSESELKDFYKVLANIPDTTTVVISLLTLNTGGKKASRWKKLIDTAAKYGTAVNMERKSASDLRKQLISWASKRNIDISGANADKIIEYSGTDLQTLQNEMEKLCSYTAQGEITADTIEKLVTKNLEARVFDMADAVTKGDSDSAFSKLDLLLYQREEPVNILAVLSSSYVDMYRVRTAIESGETAMKLTESFDYKRKEFRLKKAERCVKNLSAEALEKSLDILVQTNSALNSTSVNKRLLLEELISKLITASRT